MQRVEWKWWWWCCGRGKILNLSPIKAVRLTTKQIASIAYLAFSEGNKPIDFGSTLFYLHRRALVSLLRRNWVIDGGEDTQEGREGWGGMRGCTAWSVELSCRTDNQLQISETEMREVMDRQRERRKEKVEEKGNNVTFLCCRLAGCSTNADWFFFGR